MQRERGGAPDPEPGGPEELSPEAPISTPRLALLDFGSAGNSAARSLATSLLGNLMESLFDSSARTIGFTLSLGGLAGVVVPPAVGRLSDRTRSRWGRRVPYILGFSLAFALALALLPFATRFGVFVTLVGVVFAG
jgi:maltose/moltooligosaccharide transporter